MVKVKYTGNDNVRVNGLLLVPNQEVELDDVIAFGVCSSSDFKLVDDKKSKKTVISSATKADKKKRGK